MKRYIVFSLCLLLALSLGCRVTGKLTPASDAPAPAVTEAPATEAAETPAATVLPAPEAGDADLVFDTVTLSGEPISSDMLHEYDLVIVNCWADWCGPCVGEMPELERIHQEYPNVLLLGLLVSATSSEAAEATIADTGVTYPILTPAGTLTDYDSRSQYIPATYFFDSNGREIGEPVVGSMDYDGWKEVVEDLLP